MKIYIIRHGETNLNVKGVMQGWLEEPLNENGRELARLTGQGMKGIHFDRCISSPLTRAVETVKIVLQESGNPIPVETDDRIREIHFGEAEGKAFSEVGEEGKQFFLDPLSFKGFPGGERVMDVCKRTQQFLRELAAKDDGKTYLIGIHGCALRCMLNCLYENPKDFWHGHVPYNCCVNIVEASGGKMKLVAEDKLYYDSSLAVDRYKRQAEAR